MAQKTDSRCLGAGSCVHICEQACSTGICGHVDTHTPMHILIKLLKIGNKEDSLKSSQRKCYIKRRAKF